MGVEEFKTCYNCIYGKHTHDVTRKSICLRFPPLNGSYADISQIVEACGEYKSKDNTDK